MKSVEVYNKMKKKLFEGEYFFGDKIIVNHLIEEFNVSRRPVMDGLKMLENDGFIEIIPQSGSKVIDYVRENVVEDLLISSALEALCAELAAKKHTTQDINELKQYQETMKPLLLKNKDKKFYFQYNREVHYRILQMAKSNRIAERAMKLWDLNDFYLLNLTEYFNFNTIVGVEFHDEIIAAIEERDPEKAKCKMEEHFAAYIEKLEDSLPDALK